MRQPDDPVSLRLLLVNAHPDDESESAALIYRITHELGGIVDQLVVTTGEGGHRYAALAEAFYRLPLNDTAGGRSLLAQIRREELMRSSRILGIRHNYFLDQKDPGPTLDPTEALAVWDTARVKREIQMLLRFEKYDMVALLLPAPDTHGHHKTVAVLTLEAVGELNPSERPAIAGVRSDMAAADQRCLFAELPGYPVTRTASEHPAWTFDRRAPLTCHPALDYTIVVNWAIAEHKSQGFFQMELGRRTYEHFWLFEISGPAGAAKWRDFLRMAQRDSYDSLFTSANSAPEEEPLLK